MSNLLNLAGLYIYFDNLLYIFFADYDFFYFNFLFEQKKKKKPKFYGIKLKNRLSSKVTPWVRGEVHGCFQILRYK